MATTQAATGLHLGDYHAWARKSIADTSCKVTLEDRSLHEPKDGFISDAVLKAYLTVPKIDYLLHELFRTREPVVSHEVRHSYLKAFAILLYIDHGAQIESFVGNQSLKDSKLPLTSKPSDWPVADPSPCWDLFYEHQWKFLPVRLEPMGETYGPMYIMPFLSKRFLDRGGSASIHLVRVHRELDSLVANQRPPREDRLYVLKTYSGPSAAEYYKIETENFHRLRRATGVERSPVGLIEFHKSFRHGDTYNIILEHAEGGSLWEWINTKPEPKGGAEIAVYWASFGECMKGLEQIHELAIGSEAADLRKVFQGLHQDIRLRNILLVRNTTSSEFPFSMRLADLGVSHFFEVEKTGQEKEVLDLPGGQTYGAPEAFRRTAYDQGTARRVTRKIDIWALACAMLDLATWLVQGKSEVEKFRRRRMAENAGPNGKPGDRFHDGNSPNAQRLKSVTQQIQHVRDNIRANDFVTGRMLDLVESMMQPDPMSRPSMQMVQQIADRHLREGHAELAKRHERGTSHEHTQTETPENLGGRRRPAPTPSIVTSPVFRSSDNSFENPGRDIRPNSAAQLSRSTEDLARGPDHTRGPDTGQNQDGNTHSQQYLGHQRSLTLQEQTTGLGTAGSGTTERTTTHADPPLHFSPVSYRTQGTTGRDITGTPDMVGEAQEDSALANFADSRLPDATYDPVMQDHGQEPDQGQEEGHSGSITPRNTATSNRQEGPPSISIEEASDWMKRMRDRKKSWLKKLTKAEYPQLNHHNYLENLSGRKSIFLIDDGDTMQPHWFDVIELFEILLWIITTYEKSHTIEVYFTNRVDHYDRKDPEHLVKPLYKLDPSGKTDINIRLSEIIKQCDFGTPGPSRFRNKRAPCEPKSVYVLTDAAWEGGRDAAPLVKWMSQNLANKSVSREKFGIQFIRFGDEEENRKRLQLLDDLKKHAGEHIKLDIVDTEYWRNNILKMLLGSFMVIFDNQPS